MGKYSVERDRIERLCKLYGVSYSPKTLANFRAFFETYSSIREDISYLPKNVNVDVLKVEAPDIFKAMISHGRIPQEQIIRFLTSMMTSGQLETLIEKALKDVKSFGEEGFCYYKIVYMLYIDEKSHKNSEVQSEIGYGKSRYYEKREYATMLFGLMLWRQILEHWDNSIEEMLSMEKAEGRNGSLATSRIEELNFKPSLTLINKQEAVD